MFGLRNDDILYMYEETMPHKPQQNQIFKKNINLKLNDGSSAISYLTNDKGKSLAIKLENDNQYACLILNFELTSEMLDWHGIMTKVIVPGEDEVPEEETASVPNNNIAGEEYFKSGPHMMTVKLKSSCDA